MPLRLPLCSDCGTLNVFGVIVVYEPVVNKQFKPVAEIECVAP